MMQMVHSEILAADETTNTHWSGSIFFEMFIENKINALYQNVVENKLTKEQYHFSNSIIKNKKAFFVLNDFPDYFEYRPINENRKMKIRTVRQYKGHLIDLTGYADENDFLKSQLSKRARKQLISKRKKLEQTGKIAYKVFYGHMSRKEYDELFDTFFNLLEKRFVHKKKMNRNLPKWNAYRKIVFKKILRKEASLFVIFDNGKPITLTLNFHIKDTMLSEVEAFDMDYSKFNMGDISIANHLRWCLENNVKIFDLSMGNTDFKSKWCNHNYNFYHHLHYNKYNPISLILISVISTKLHIVQFLRDMGIWGGLLQSDAILYKLNSKRT